MTVDEWVEARVADVNRREFSNSLLTIGPDKPMGGLGFKGAPLFWRIWMGLRILWHLGRTIGRDAGSVTMPGWVYMCHMPALQALLDRDREMLEAAGWPILPLDFIQRTRTETVDPKTPLYDLIADAYGDKLNPGRTDVMPGVDPFILLNAFTLATGLPDPAAVYFMEFP